jgi:hypothetical protein
MNRAGAARDFEVIESHPRGEDPPNRPHRSFMAIWYTVNSLLILTTLLAIYSAGWEYSTRRYLKGFSDAIIPESSSTQDKVEAILYWMAHGPARQQENLDPASLDRDPTTTLNYASLLQVCGTATNAFINLAESEGLRTRRLLLLDSRRMTKHVVAEVLLDGRWVVVDPAFRVMLRGTDGGFLTREQLANPAVFSVATSGIPGYSPYNSYESTAHIRLARIRFAGVPLRALLGKIFPGWENSSMLSLLLERESLATLILATVLVLLLAFLRIVLRWYGEVRMGFRSARIRQQLRRASQAFFEVSP